MSTASHYVSYHSASCFLKVLIKPFIPKASYLCSQQGRKAESLWVSQLVKDEYLARCFKNKKETKNPNP